MCVFVCIHLCSFIISSATLKCSNTFPPPYRFALHFCPPLHICPALDIDTANLPRDAYLPHTCPAGTFTLHLCATLHFCQMNLPHYTLSSYSITGERKRLRPAAAPKLEAVRRYLRASSQSCEPCGVCSMSCRCRSSTCSSCSRSSTTMACCDAGGNGFNSDIDGNKLSGAEPAPREGTAAYRSRVYARRWAVRVAGGEQTSNTCARGP